MTSQNGDLKTLREMIGRVLIMLLWVHLPVSIAIGMARGGDWLTPGAFTAVMAAAATLPCWFAM